MPSTMSEKKHDPRKRPTPDEQRSRIQSDVPTVRVAVPFVASMKYAQREIAIRLDLEDATTLRGVMEALEAKHAQLKNGKVVESAHDAIRWMLEEVARGTG